MEIIIAIVAILIVIDIYFRLKNHTREEVLENLKSTNPKDYEAYKKSLLKMGIDIDK